MPKIRISLLIISFILATISSALAGVSFIVDEGDSANSSSEVNVSGNFQKRSLR